MCVCVVFCISFFDSRKGGRGGSTRSAAVFFGKIRIHFSKVLCAVIFVSLEEGVVCVS